MKLNLTRKENDFFLNLENQTINNIKMFEDMFPDYMFDNYKLFYIIHKGWSDYIYQYYEEMDIKNYMDKLRNFFIDILNYDIENVNMKYGVNYLNENLKILRLKPEYALNDINLPLQIGIITLCDNRYSGEKYTEKIWNNFNFIYIL